MEISTLFIILDEDFLDEMTEEHNKLRSIHLSPPLVKNRNMSLQAKALAIQLAAEANLRHSDKISRPDQGENLAMGCTSSGPGITAKDAAKEWLDPKKNDIRRNNKQLITKDKNSMLFEYRSGTEARAKPS